MHESAAQEAVAALAEAVTVAVAAIPAVAAVASVKLMNERNAWSPYVTWLQSDDRMESYLRNIDDYSVESLKKTLQNLNEDHERAKLLLKARTNFLRFYFGTFDKNIIFAP